ncbi:MAG: hypothetical protein ACTHM5_09105 [Ginsengibacter sp.]
MNEVLLQTIVEKLEALEIALLKQSPPAKERESSNELATAVKFVQTELIKLNSEVRTNTDCVTNLSNQINTLRLNFAHPEQNQVKHIHHFHKHIWISLSLFIVSLLCAYGWMNCHSEKKQFEANDIKYRFWKANGNTSLLKVVYQTDSLYNLNNDAFTNGVLRAEHTIAEQEKKHRLAGEKKKKR